MSQVAAVIVQQQQPAVVCEFCTVSSAGELAVDE